MKDIGLLFFGARPIDGFTAKCDKCGSANISIDYSATHSEEVVVEVACRDCGQLWASDA